MISIIWINENWFRNINFCVNFGDLSFIFSNFLDGSLIMWYWKIFTVWTRINFGRFTNTFRVLNFVRNLTCCSQKLLFACWRSYFFSCIISFLFVSLRFIGLIRLTIWDSWRISMIIKSAVLSLIQECLILRSVCIQRFFLFDKLIKWF